MLMAKSGHVNFRSFCAHKFRYNSAVSADESANEQN